MKSSPYNIIIFIINFICYFYPVKCQNNFDVNFLNGNSNFTDNHHKYHNTISSDSEKIKIRHKRYAAFPEGSLFSVSFCETLGAIGDPQYPYMSWAINFGVAYELPNETFIINNNNALKKHPVPKAVVQRRYRRDLYHKFELIMKKMGFNGRECILRALCESSQMFYKKGSNMIQELIRTVFTLPKSKVLSFEHNTLFEYDTAHRKGRNRVICSVLYPECSFSLLDMALGHYSQPYNYM